MKETMKLAVPTLGSGGFASKRSDHFRRCDCFTVVDIVDNCIVDVSELKNPSDESGVRLVQTNFGWHAFNVRNDSEHEEVDCLRVAELLSRAGANAIVAADMSSRAVAVFGNAGIEVLTEHRASSVGDAVEAVTKACALP
ncbi:NifB/NifX family molybdenum-iron cluster-binding protein [Gordonibacter massiliensis (ex Traore et al. 2017)]|uniref:NifB/NifX family molybdenum-iron cluster-binding protein n=1 Tax=Gordonibacter massiliensis (ex Traore et al. 2017) TaxID=1841863 RepID=UPI001C8CE86A|nr:NifB/NifX family molybdenum-iron cluster-binding protein [Gordonibacter massiliensis (ex Traore et al. 2017)]MBX9032593.1 dinitrogenase iron-molybdenum cofactor biosynthesis protein [Gordonibacter massiliensis (ex Traore et al. 2017)]